MKKSVLLTLSVLVLTSCSQTKVKESNVPEVPVQENVEAYVQKFHQQSLVDGEYSEEEVTMPDDERKAAYDALQSFREDNEDRKEILNALDIVDEFYINNNSMQATRKAYGVKSEDEIYQNQYTYLMESFGLKEDAKLSFQNKEYKANEWGPKALKVTVNTLQQSAAYEINFANYDRKAQKVYLHLSVPTVDTFQYIVFATYRDDYQDFFEPLEDLLMEEDRTTEEWLIAKFLYYTKAVGGEEGAARLSGMTWGSLSDLYLALDVAKDGSIQLTDEMVGALAQVSTSESNEKLAPLFEELETTD
ncbi:hypothetical protein ABID29_001861 [Streptococcus rupicaprae]|uniref:Lipoprotein n=1 Tax=Streptococcus rupicaprae TaxID=759619 RepID=A0ABV2FJP7_9STRE